MRLGSVFKMRTSIINTATTEQMGYIIFSFFVYTKSTNQSLVDKDMLLLPDSIPYYDTGTSRRCEAQEEGEYSGEL